MLTVVAVHEKNVPAVVVSLSVALAAGLLTTKGILNPAVAIAMSEANSPATGDSAKCNHLHNNLHFFSGKIQIPPGA